MRIRLTVLVLVALMAPGLAFAMCPAGFLEVKSQGIPLGCMQEAEENPLSTQQTWLDASLARIIREEGAVLN